MEILKGILIESASLLGKMAPYLIFGYFFAGIIHVFLRTETVSKHLGRNDLSSVIKSAFFGIPLPLCSCSVIPAAMSLRKDGASKGATLSFLISTPTTGIDSIFATYSLLGGFFTVYRIIASFITGVFSGILANIFSKDKDDVRPNEEHTCKVCGNGDEHDHKVRDKIKTIFTYAFGDLLSDSGKSIIAGIFIGGAIAYFIPESFIKTYLGSGIKSMLLMLVIGIPMYVCATASIPIAAALMFKGMDPGAAFVFLIAGPATNVVTMSVVSKDLGIRALVIYLGSIILCSIGLGWLFNITFSYFFDTGIIRSVTFGHEVLPGWVRTISSLLILSIIAFDIFRNDISVRRKT